MSINNYQKKVWKGNFGEEFTKRNTFKSYDDWNNFYKKRYNLTKEEINKDFLGKLPKKIKILEVGCNIGNQLSCLYKMGFKNLYGIELQKKCLMIIKKKKKFINVVNGSADYLPFENNSFDLVFTNNVLIHISPSEIKNIVNEIYRISSKWIWGFEYYSKNYEEIVYRNKKELLWKANFSEIFKKKGRLKVLKEKLFQNISLKNEIDKMYLLKKN